MNKMTILITKENVPFFMDIAGLTRKDFEHSTKHTCTFEWPIDSFEELYADVKKWGNPFAMMTW